MTLTLRVAALTIALAAPSSADDLVVPNNAPTTAGSGGYSTLLRSQARSYQLVVGPQELSGMPAGSIVTGVTWRMPTWQVFPDWPGAASVCSWTNYDIYLSSSLNAPGSLSTTYTDNIGPDVTLVRGGPLTLSGAFFPGGMLSPQVNPFGTTLVFTTPYVYQGGDLLLTIRHDGNNCGSNGSLDTVPSPHTQAIGVSSYTQPDQWYAQGLISMKLEFTPPGSPGTNYCTPAIANTSGAPGVLSASGSAVAAVNGLSLNAGQLPSNQFGFFLTSRTQGFTASPGGSQGNLCLGGTIGRYVAPGQIQNAGASGALTLALDLTRTPEGPVLVAIQAGETWNFQTWFRDIGPGGAPWSNFTNGLSVTFH